MSSGWLAVLILIGHGALQVIFILRALLRRHREPSSRMAWVLVILIVPAAGIAAYFLFGETNIGSRRIARYQRAKSLLDELPRPDVSPDRVACVRPEHRHLFRIGLSVSGFPPEPGNRAEVMRDSNASIDALVADIDAATDTVHLLFYIWLADTNGLKVAEAAKRAARRGVSVRVLADDLGSRHLIRSDHWRQMAEAGVRTARALPVGNILAHPFRGRIDLRNHRKIVVIDNRVTYCGSQNCADPEFRVKPRFAPWVDLVARFEGPVAVQNQTLFIQDWMMSVGEDLTHLVALAPEPPAQGGIVAQVVGTGPTVRPSAMPEVFEVLIHAARRQLTVTTPYYVPSEAMHSALCAAGHRGVETRLVVPARNDSWIVAAASRSYYSDLIDAGVKIYEYEGGLLHAKTLTLDDDVTLLGSANLDRRSFDLNYESNILLQDAALTATILERQRSYIAGSRAIDAAEIEAWSVWRQIWNNSIAMLGPIL